MPFVVGWVVWDEQIVSTDATGVVKVWDLDGPNLGRSMRSLRCDPRAAHVLLLPNVYQIITSHPDGGARCCTNCVCLVCVLSGLVCAWVCCAFWC